MCKTVENIFAADIVSHKNCKKRYLLQYQRHAEEIINYDEADDEVHVSDPVKVCAAKLRIENSYSNADQLEYSLTVQVKSFRILGAIL